MSTHHSSRIEHRRPIERKIRHCPARKCSYKAMLSPAQINEVAVARTHSHKKATEGFRLGFAFKRFESRERILLGAMDGGARRKQYFASR